MTVRGNAVPLRPLSHTSRDADHEESDPHHVVNHDSSPTQTDTAQRRREEILNKRVVRKLDTLLLPFLALLFLTNSLDRSNIGAAETANFTSDLSLPPSALNTAVAVFFAFFVTLQPVGAALGRKYGMTRYVPLTMGLWGACTCLHVLVRKEWQLVGLRGVIGCLEAGFYPTTVAYLSLFYTRWEFGRRLGGFYGMYAVAGAVGGLLSYVVFSGYDETKGTEIVVTDTKWKPWQTLFLLEGGLTMIIALLGFFWLPRSARRAWFLSAEEKIWAEERIQRDQNGSNSSPQSLHDDTTPMRGDAETDDMEAHGLLSGTSEAKDPINKDTEKSFTMATNDAGLTSHDVFSALTDWKVWYLLLFNILSAIPSTAFSIFLPLVLQSFSPSDTPNSAAKTNLLTVPPFLIGATILYIFAAWSDRAQQRLRPILWSLSLVLLGLSALAIIPVTWPLTRYFSLCILLSGTFIASPLTIAWLSNNIPSAGKRSVVLGINGWGNFAGILSSLLFAPRFAPDYTFPFLITLVCVAFSFLGFAGFRYLLVRENKRRKALMRGWSEEDVKAEMRFGRGPYKAKKNRRESALLSFFVRFAGSFGTSLTEFIEDESRSGDERLTFVYSY